MLRHKEPRPWLVCVHGAEMGRAALDLTLFRAWHLHEDLGLNVVLPVLPMHGPRARGLPKGAVFPGEDVMDNVHATAQAVWDVRRLLSWIRSQQPESPIGLNSISLGGYVTSLVASLEDGLTCAILGVVTELFRSSISRPFLVPMSRMGHCGARSWAERPFLVGDGAAEPGTYDSMTGASSAVAAPNRGGSRDRKDPRRFNHPVRTLAFGVAGSQPRHLATVPRGRGLVHDVGRSGEVPVSPALSSA